MSIVTRFTTRHDGDIRKKKFDDIIFAEQVHGTKIAVVLKNKGKVIPGVDGLVYHGDGRIRLAVRVADCVPILAYDDQAEVVGVAHAGWRGTLGNIAGELIKTMCDKGADPANIRVSIGPHISMCHYDVTRERAKKYLDMFDNDTKVASFFENRWHVDIGWANYRQLVHEGIVPAHIDARPTCTYCQNDKYFSFRRDTKETFGEIMGVVSYER